MAAPTGVSVIMTAYNVGPYVGEALESIFAQTLPPDEVVVVDDGSTDDSAAVVEAVGGARVRLVRQDHRGYAVAFNRGVAEARCPLLMIQDGDDIAVPERVRASLDLMSARPGCDGIFATAMNFYSPELAPLMDVPPPQSPPDSMLMGCSMIKADLFRRFGPFDEELPTLASTEWITRVREAGGVLLRVPEGLLHRRLHRHNVSRKKNAQALLEAAVRLKSRRDSR